MTVIRRRLAAALCIAFFGVSACDREGASWALSSCDSTRVINDWIVTAGLERETGGEAIFAQWEARRNYATNFGLRLTYDTGSRPEPFLQIWHNYKNGAFQMVLPDGSFFNTPLNSNYAVTEMALSPAVIEFLSTQPVRIEHTSPEGKWLIYRTDGLPEAISGAKADLRAAQEKLDNRKCSAKSR